MKAQLGLRPRVRPQQWEYGTLLSPSAGWPSGCCARPDIVRRISIWESARGIERHPSARASAKIEIRVEGAAPREPDIDWICHDRGVGVDHRAVRHRPDGRS